jgi:hypothetical protein
LLAITARSNFAARLANVSGRPPNTAASTSGGIASRQWFALKDAVSFAGGNFSCGSMAEIRIPVGLLFGVGHE